MDTERNIAKKYKVIVSIKKKYIVFIFCWLAFGSGYFLFQLIKEAFIKKGLSAYISLGVFLISLIYILLYFWNLKDKSSDEYNNYFENDKYILFKTRKTNNTIISDKEPVSELSNNGQMAFNQIKKDIEEAGMKMRSEDAFHKLIKSLSKPDYPKLISWYKRNPHTLKETLESLADKYYEGDITSAAQILESDLEHEKVNVYNSDDDEILISDEKKQSRLFED
jgi:hypothetical protein